MTTAGPVHRRPEHEHFESENQCMCKAVRSISKVFSSVVKKKMKKQVGGTDAEHPFPMLAQMRDLGSVNAPPSVLQILFES